MFVQSQRMSEDTVAKCIPVTKMTPVQMGVDMNDVHDIPNCPTDDPRLDERRIIAYLGTLDRPRRIEILFEMLALVKKKVPNVLLVLVGDTADKAHQTG